MTNADKAFELLNKLDFEDGKYEVTDALIDMGEWKDAQIATQKQALIDKACAWIDTYSQYRSDLIAKNLNEKFIDEFRKAMEEEK